MLTQKELSEIRKTLPKDVIARIATILYPHCSCTPAMPDARRIYDIVIKPLDEAFEKSEYLNKILYGALKWHCEKCETKTGCEQCFAYSAISVYDIEDLRKELYVKSNYHKKRLAELIDAEDK